MIKDIPNIADLSLSINCDEIYSMSGRVTDIGVDYVTFLAGNVELLIRKTDFLVDISYRQKYVLYANVDYEKSREFLLSGEPIPQNVDGRMKNKLVLHNCSINVCSDDFVVSEVEEIGAKVDGLIPLHGVVIDDTLRLAWIVELHIVCEVQILPQFGNGDWFLFHRFHGKIVQKGDRLTGIYRKMKSPFEQSFSINSKGQFNVFRVMNVPSVYLPNDDKKMDKIFRTIWKAKPDKSDWLWSPLFGYLKISPASSVPEELHNTFFNVCMECLLPKSEFCWCPFAKICDDEKFSSTVDLAKCIKFAVLRNENDPNSVNFRKLLDEYMIGRIREHQRTMKATDSEGEEKEASDKICIDSMVGSSRAAEPLNSNGVEKTNAQSNGIKRTCQQREEEKVNGVESGHDSNKKNENEGDERINGDGGDSVESRRREFVIQHFSSLKISEQSQSSCRSLTHKETLLEALKAEDNQAEGVRKPKSVTAAEFLQRRKQKLAAVNAESTAKAEQEKEEGECDDEKNEQQTDESLQKFFGIFVNTVSGENGTANSEKKLLPPNGINSSKSSNSLHPSASIDDDNTEESPESDTTLTAARIKPNGLNTETTMNNKGESTTSEVTATSSNLKRRVSPEQEDVEIVGVVIRQFGNKFVCLHAANLALSHFAVEVKSFNESPVSGKWFKMRFNGILDDGPIVFLKVSDCALICCNEMSVPIQTRLSANTESTEILAELIVGRKSKIDGFRLCYSVDLPLVIDSGRVLRGVRRDARVLAWCALRKFSYQGVFWKVSQVFKILNTGSVPAESKAINASIKKRLKNSVPAPLKSKDKVKVEPTLEPKERKISKEQATKNSCSLPNNLRPSSSVGVGEKSEGIICSRCDDGRFLDGDGEDADYVVYSFRFQKNALLRHEVVKKCKHADVDYENLLGTWILFKGEFVDEQLIVTEYSTITARFKTIPTFTYLLVSYDIDIPHDYNLNKLENGVISTAEMGIVRDTQRLIRREHVGCKLSAVVGCEVTTSSVSALAWKLLHLGTKDM